MKDLLQSLSLLGEGETKDTKTGRVHKGSYGSEYETDREGNEKKKEVAAVKKGRGRPKKDGGEETKFDSSALNSVFGGKKPSKSVGTVSKKHSLKEYIESVEDTKNAEAVMESMFDEGVDHSSIAANLGKLAKVIKSVQTPEQFAVAQKYAQRMSGAIQQHQHGNMGFGSGLRANIQVSRAIQDDLKRKAAELGIEYKALEEEGGISVKPMPGASQIVNPEGETIGTADAQTAQMIKQASEQGKLSLGDQSTMDEDASDDAIAAFLAKGGQIQQGKPQKGPRKPGLSFASRHIGGGGDKMRASRTGKGANTQGKLLVQPSHVYESISLAESPETLQHIISKFKNEVKRFIAGEELDNDLFDALFDYYSDAGELPYGVAKGRTGDPFEWITQRFEQDVHDHVVDESTARDFTQHALAEPTQNFTKPGTPMAQPRGTPTTANRPVQDPTPWGKDPIAAATDRAFNFVSSLGKGTKFTKEGTEMKDIQLESWEKQLNGLLNEGITVSSSQGQQGAPDSVSVTATDTDADALLSVLRNAGIGGFGAEQPAPEVGYGVTQGGEEDFNGTGTEPQPSPDVVGDDGDMLSMLKKMAGIGGGDAEVVAIGGDEGGEDYEDEEGSEEQAQTLEPATGEEGSEEESSEEGSEEESSEEEEEVTDEGNAFTGKLKQTPQGGEFKMGDKEYKDTSAIEEEQACESCGQSPCGCDHEQVEENFANTSGHGTVEQELAKLKALLSMGNDMHRMKQSQAMGNPVRVAESDALAQWKKLSGI